MIVLFTIHLEHIKQIIKYHDKNIEKIEIAESFVYLICFKYIDRIMILINAKTINTPAMNVSSLIPFIFNIIIMATKAMANMIIKTRKTGARMKLNRCFFISKIADKTIYRHSERKDKR